MCPHIFLHLFRCDIYVSLSIYLFIPIFIHAFIYLSLDVVCPPYIRAVGLSRSSTVSLSAVG